MALDLLKTLNSITDGMAKHARPLTRKFLLPSFITVASAYGASEAGIVDSIQNLASPESFNQVIGDITKAAALTTSAVVGVNYALKKFKTKSAPAKKQLGKWASIALASTLLYTTPMLAKKTLDTFTEPFQSEELVSYVAPEEVISSKNLESLLAEQQKDSTVFKIINYDDLVVPISVQDQDFVNLVRDKSYISVKNNSVDKEVLDSMYVLLSQLSAEDLIVSSKLGGLYKTFTGLNKSDSIDYELALENMWISKTKLINQNSSLSYKEKIMLKKYGELFVEEYDVSSTQKVSFNEYRKEINRCVSDKLAVFEKESFLADKHSEKRRFFENVLPYLTGDVLLAYSLTELTPNINPIANISYWDDVLKNAGPEFISKIPALGDGLFSFGPAQHTPYTVSFNAGLKDLRKYFPNGEGPSFTLEEYDTWQEHFTGSVSNMIYNAQIVSNVMFKNNKLTSVNDFIESLPEDTRRSFVESFFCVTNYNPRGAKNGVVDFVDKVKNKTYSAESVLENIRFPQGKADVQDYYSQSMQNLLVLRNLDIE